jgi:CheY-like chemotaxis protein/HPt (histidine-containing phosphotransfer) domain-containing protein
MGDEARLGQILINLIGNALKFTPSGGVEIHVLPKPPIDGRQPLRFEVRDTGIGIPEEKLQFLFTRFTQADSSISRRFGGSGLGLSITKSLVDLMGGEIGVESLKGEGTTFWFTLELPIAAQTEKIRDEDVPTAQAAVRRRLLIVDDLDVNRELAAALLAPSGHQIDLAADGSEAIAFARANPYDLIFMDVQMPGMDGLTATRRIREMPRIARMPIVALTAQALPEQIAACRAAGMDDYLSKPFTPQGLMAMIAKWAGSGVAPAVSAPEEHQAEPEAEIDELDALRLRFLERTKQDAARIKVLLGETKDADFVELKSLVHRFAGSAGSFGFPEAGDVALALDQELARGGPPSPEAFGPLLSALDAALAA